MGVEGKVEFGLVELGLEGMGYLWYSKQRRQGQERGPTNKEQNLTAAQNIYSKEEKGA